MGKHGWICQKDEANLEIRRHDMLSQNGVLEGGGGAIPVKRRRSCEDLRGSETCREARHISAEKSVLCVWNN